MATGIDKVRIIVAGDSGVGKTSLVHLISQNEIIKSPSWTVGCSVEVKLHEYKEGTQDQKSYFIEFWDIGGSNSHRNARSVFYNPTHGVILVHDLTNSKSEENLKKWIAEVFNIEEQTNSLLFMNNSDMLDSENFLGVSQIPILIIGTKLSLSKEKIVKKRRGKISEHFGCDEIVVDCLDIRSFAPASSNAVSLTKFYNKVIEKKYYSRETMQPMYDRRKRSNPNTYVNILTKNYHD